MKKQNQEKMIVCVVNSLAILYNRLLFKNTHTHSSSHTHKLTAGNLLPVYFHMTVPHISSQPFRFFIIPIPVSVSTISVTWPWPRTVPVSVWPRTVWISTSIIIPEKYTITDVDKNLKVFIPFFLSVLWLWGYHIKSSALVYTPSMPKFVFFFFGLQPPSELD